MPNSALPNQAAGDNGTPGELPMLPAYLPMMKSAAMTSAAELGVFHFLHATPAAASEVAHSLNTSLQGMVALLHTLQSHELIWVDGDGRYHNSLFIEENFTPAAVADFTPGLLWNAEAARLMLGLTDAIKAGGPTESMWAQMRRRPEMGAMFSHYMEAFAQSLSAELLANVPVPPDARQLLDIGGSHGRHAAAFCQRYPQLSATVFDFEDSLAHTPRVIEQHGLTERMSLRVGDAVTDDFGRASDGGDFDVVLLLSVLHNQTEAQAKGIIERAAAALNPGGLLVIHEYFHDATHPTKYTSSFLLTLLVEVGTALQKPEQVQAWLAEAGCPQIRRVELEQGKGSLVLATRARIDERASTTKKAP